MTYPTVPGSKSLLQQGQHGLAGLVGLRQHGGGGTKGRLIQLPIKKPDRAGASIKYQMPYVSLGRTNLDFNVAAKPS
jgi:hypothetical protein